MNTKASIFIHRAHCGGEIKMLNTGVENGIIQKEVDKDRN